LLKTLGTAIKGGETLLRSACVMLGKQPIAAFGTELNARDISAFLSLLGMEAKPEPDQGTGRVGSHTTHMGCAIATQGNGVRAEPLKN